jgi:hypothetical protein
MVYFQTKPSNFGILWKALEFNFFIYFMTVWYSMWLFALSSSHLLYFPHFGMLYQAKSGNPGMYSISAITKPG